jgi:hypothetical protein
MDGSSANAKVHQVWFGLAAVAGFAKFCCENVLLSLSQKYKDLLTSANHVRPPVLFEKFVKILCILL